MGVLADSTGLHVRNLDRDHHVPWSEVHELTIEAIEQMDGPVTYVVLHRADGSRLVLGGTSTFRRSVAEGWRATLRSVSPAPG
ncbi:MAG: Bacterial domain [Actinomycetia bacterium]|nr:Bacterial domain [Actinomycetes bacterium]